MAAKWRSTVGYERKYNQALQITDRDEFIKHLTTNMPPAPDHFSRCSEINRKGPARLSELPPLRELEPAQFMEKMKGKNTQVLDARAYYSFGGQHVPGSWNIAHDGNFPTFAGWVIPPKDDILLVTESFGAAKEAAVWFQRVGLDQVTGYLKGGVFEWAVNGLHLESVRQISTETLHRMTEGSTDFVLLDVRAPMEYEDNHIKGAINIPAPDLRERHGELDPEKLTVVMCSTGHRSSLAASILKRHGFDRIFNAAGGITGFSHAGYTRRCSVCVNPHGSRYFNREYHQKD
jgi:rhodanese-related sulfurtransferase